MKFNSFFYEKDLWDSWDWDWDWDTNFERSQGLGPGQKALGRLGLGHKSLGRPGTESLWDSCPWDSNPLGLLGRPMPIPEQGNLENKLSLLRMNYLRI